MRPKKHVKIEKNFDDYLDVKEIHDYILGLDGKSGHLFFKRLGGKRK